MSDNKQATLDLGAMMEQSLDTIPDAPDYANPPAGDYRLDTKDCGIDNYKTKPKDGTPSTDAQRLKITYSIATTYATAGNEQPVPDGTLFTETFQATEQGLGYFKKRIKEIMNASDLSGVSLKDMMDSVKGVAFDCRISIKQSPNPTNPGQPYENVQIRVIQPKVPA